jgi:hemerythrin-like domain-containing protein
MQVNAVAEQETTKLLHVIISELGQLPPEAEQYDAKLTVLMENVEHHTEEEEGEMFPQAEKKLGKELDTLGEQMAKRKEQLKAAASSALQV